MEAEAVNGTEAGVGVRLLIQGFVPGLFALIILIGFVGNSLVITVFAMNQTMQNSTNFLILNLACADLAFVLFCVPSTAAQYMLANWPFGDVACRAVKYLQFVSALGSVWTLVLMAFERFLSVAYPVKALSIRNLPHAVIACCFLWLVIGLSQIYVLFSHGTFNYSYQSENRTMCAHLIEVSRHPNATVVVIAFYLSFNLIAYFIPLSITCVVYAWMVYELWQNRLQRTLSHCSILHKRRITKLVGIVTLTFAICWLPENVWFLWQSWIFPRPMVTSEFWLGVQIFAQIFAYMNSCLNPILYGILSTNFRMGFENTCLIILCQQAKYSLRRQDSSKKRSSERLRIRLDSKLLEPRRKFSTVSNRFLSSIWQRKHERTLANNASSTLDSAENFGTDSDPSNRNLSLLNSDIIMVEECVTFV